MQTARDRWAKRVRQWEQSGLTAAAFAAEWDINPRTLAHWKWKLGKERDAGASTASAIVSPSFVEVTPPTSTWWQPAERIEIVIDDRVVVRVPDTFDPAALHRVMHALTTAPEDGA